MNIFRFFFPKKKKVEELNNFKNINSNSNTIRLKVYSPISPRKNYESVNIEDSILNPLIMSSLQSEIFTNSENNTHSSMDFGGGGFSGGGAGASFDIPSDYGSDSSSDCSSSDSSCSCD